MIFRDLVRLEEAKFSEKNIEKVVKLYSKIMSNRMGGSFKPLGFEDFKRKMGSGKGFRVMNNSGSMLRFNWDAKLAKKTTYELTSMDYWAPKNTNFQRPTRTVTFGPDLNVVQILDSVSDALLSGNINESRKIVKAVNLIVEKRNSKEKAAWMTQNGFPASYTADSKMRQQVAAKKPELADQLEVFLGEKETNSFEGELKTVERKLDQTVYANPETIFDDIEDLLGVVASKKWRTLIVCGMGGVGKTWHVTEGPRSLKALLGAEGDKWTYHSGTKASPLAFYKTLFQERDKVIVFDEADAILKHSEIVMMLKPILDTSGSNMAEYITGTANMVGKSKQEIEDYANYVDAELAEGKIIGKKNTEDTVMLPSKFSFTGGMVFISNMKAAEIEQAIMSRSIFIDVYLAERDVLKRIKTIGYAQAGASDDVTIEDIDDVLESLGAQSGGKEEEITYMTPEYARKSKSITVRAMQLALMLKKAGLPRWSELAALYA